MTNNANTNNVNTINEVIDRILNDKTRPITAKNKSGKKGILNINLLELIKYSIANNKSEILFAFALKGLTLKVQEYIRQRLDKKTNLDKREFVKCLLLLETENIDELPETEVM